MATILGIGPSVLRAPAEQTKVATILGIAKLRKRESRETWNFASAGMPELA